MNGAAWNPGPEHLARSRLRHFCTRHGCATVDDLRRRGAEDPAWFWQVTLSELGIEWTRPPSQVLDLSQGKPWARWFPDAGFNYTAAATDRWIAQGRAAEPALVWEGEEGAQGTLTYAELGRAVAQAAGALKALGVKPGDRVGVFMPLTLECAVATLACGRVGAIFTPIFSGYGAAAVATRLVDSGASLLITADGFFRRGQLIPMKETADEAMREAPTVRHCLVVRRTARPLEGLPWKAGRDVWWHDLVPGQGAPHPAADTAADDPYMIIYTSGTTGRPKGARQDHAGFPLTAAADQALCFDIQPGDRLFWYSDIGWMMAPWLIQGTLLLGATAFLYDGAPDWPQPDRVWDLIERHRLTVLGIAPTAIRALMRQDPAYVRRHDLTSLRALASSGETWTPDAWWWYFREAGGGRCPILNYSGGTEVSGGIVAATTIEPLRPCAFAGAVPGMAADVVDEAGRPVRGQVGELIVRQPWVGMTQGFWGGPPGEDPQRELAARERYLETYWSRFPDVWVHGDWALIEDGAWYIHGRSDDTIKAAGKRVGPAEVESAAAAHPAVAEAAAIGLPHELKGEAIVVFCVLRPGHEPSPATMQAIGGVVAEHLGRALRPDRVYFTSELPKTRNAKVMRRLIRAVARDQAELGDLTGLENPAALEAIKNAIRSAPAPSAGN
jgi:acetyl-CoA synthetase